MSEFSEWMAKYELYLDGKIEYQDLQPRPGPPPTATEMTPQEVKATIDEATRLHRRTATKFFLLCAIPALVCVSAVMFALHAAWWATLGAQWATSYACVRVFNWYLDRRTDPQLADKRDPTLDETKSN